MQPNVMYIVLDGLSDWYLNEYTKLNPNCFFERMRDKGYSCDRMYSCGPFTEAALNAICFARNTFDTRYMQNNLFLGEKSIFDYFSEAGYDIYKPNLFVGGAGMSELIYKDEGFTKEMLLESFWLGMDYLCSIKKKKEIDIESAICLLNHFFIMNDDKKFCYEKERFKSDKRNYTLNLLDEKSNHVLYRICHYSNGGVDGGSPCYRKAMEEGFINEELELQNLLYRKNLNIYQRLNLSFKQEEYSEKDLINNRDMQESANFFGSREYTNVSFEKGRQRVITWLNNKGKNVPFFCYFHSLDFHFPSIITKTAYGEDGYIQEIRDKIDRIENIDESKLNMSILRYMAIDNLDKELDEFYKQLVDMNIVENTYIVVMADHGLTNFMYPPIERNRWVFCDMMFKIPFFLFGNDVPHIRDMKYRKEQDIMPTLMKLCGINTIQSENLMFNTEGEDTIEAEWINGRIDFLRSQLKFGIRDSNYSITIGVYLHQFFDSCEIISIFDLRQDPDEIRNCVQFPHEIDVLEIESLLEKLRERYFELCKRIYCGEYFYFNSVNCEIGNLFRDTKEYWKTASYICKCNLEEFNRDIDGKNLYLFGATEVMKKCIINNKIQTRIAGIFDNDKNKVGTYLYGHLIMEPFYFDDFENSNSVVLILGSYEMEMVLQLIKLNVKSCYIWRSIEREEVFKEMMRTE